MVQYDAVIVGGGASGLMCAIEAARRGLRVVVLEKGPKVGLKILVSGGGRCNFTNSGADPRSQYLSENEHFCISAMKRYEPADFIAMVDEAGIAWHEKKLGQLFCDDSAKQIVAMLLEHCANAGVEIHVSTEVKTVRALADGGFEVATVDKKIFTGYQAVIASGGLSLPKIATDFAFRTANRLDINIVAPRPALVPFTWNTRDRDLFAPLSGIAVDASVTCGEITFDEAVLFTHRGLSGPGILQISSYWREGETVHVNLLPHIDAASWLREQRDSKPQQRLVTVLKSRLPNRLVEAVAGVWFEDTKIGSYSPVDLDTVAARFASWPLKPGGTEGYRTAEVTLGGIDTSELSSKTFELRKVPGLFAIGEAIDVTGWLGGYNFQWAWASGWCCAQHLDRAPQTA